MATYKRWRDLPANVKKTLTVELRTYSAFYIGWKYGVCKRTVANWRTYANSRPEGNLKQKVEQYKRTPEEIADARDRDDDEDDARDDLVLDVYRSLRCDVGTTSREIAKQTGHAAVKVFEQLKYLKDGRLAERRRGKWFAVKPLANGAGWFGKSMPALNGKRISLI